MPLTGFDVGVLIAGVFVVLACMITFNSIRLHYLHSKQPQIRNFTIRILLMIPVYGIEAWMAMFFVEYAVLFQVLREGYEAFVIVSFMQLMLTYLGGPLSLARDLAARRQVTKHLPPLCCVKPWKGAKFVRLTLIGTLQYVPCSLFVMALSISTWFAGAYHEGNVALNDSYIYSVVIMNFSQMWALYCLVLFYQGTKEDLKPINPLPKFLCIKFIIFFTWFQGIVISIMTHYKWVKLSSNPDQEDKYESQLQNFIICLEMLILAVCHSYAFPSTEFNVAHNPRSATAVLANQWDNNVPEDHFSSDSAKSESKYERRSSPRSGITALPVRMAKSVGRAVNNRVERLQRLGSGVMASTGEVMSGVNLFDIWLVLRQTQELDALASQDDAQLQKEKEEEALESGGFNAGLGSPHDMTLVCESPLCEDLLAKEGEEKENVKHLELTKNAKSRKSEDEAARSPLRSQPQNKKELAAAWDLV